ncbi:hypothetical protein [Clostridium butyricum]|uniref:hypothetical protein n=1 Tax=Clostridium butyricum TaxID=1492 RepID=UPI00040B877B|nr:hypothetical protein [Clostridium butyricum]MDB2152235.1 hypothetical protein [Clostridium butyricum]
MNDNSILIFLLFITLLCIMLYFALKLYFYEKRHFTFEIITIPLGIFKFDKRDEYLKNKVVKTSREEIHMEIKKSNYDVKTNLKESELSKESNGKLERLNNSIDKDKLSYKDACSKENTSTIVYWTAGGKAYHTSKQCRTLSRSKVIFNGTKDESRKELQCIHCK